MSVSRTVFPCQAFSSPSALSHRLRNPHLCRIQFQLWKNSPMLRARDLDPRQTHGQTELTGQVCKLFPVERPGLFNFVASLMDKCARAPISTLSDRLHRYLLFPRFPCTSSLSIFHILIAAYKNCSPSEEGRYGQNCQEGSCVNGAIVSTNLSFCIYLKEFCFFRCLCIPG